MPEFVNVSVKIGNKTQSLKMEKGVKFENNGGEYSIDKKGNLQIFDKNTFITKPTDEIKMTNYQWKVLQNIMNNDGDKTTYSKDDIQAAIKQFQEGKFTSDISDGLPSIYKVKSDSQVITNSSIETEITNVKNSSATLIFSIMPKKQAKAEIGAKQELVNQYSKEFENKNPAEIAKLLEKQISGLSSSTKTLSMFDAIPDEKLAEVYKSFSDGIEWEGKIRQTLFSGKDHTYAWRKPPLFEELFNEFGINKEELNARIKRLQGLLNFNYDESLMMHDPTTALLMLENTIANKLDYEPPYAGKGLAGKSFTRTEVRF